MTVLKRHQIINAEEVDSMLGTTRWEADARGSYGDLDGVTIKWIDGTHRGYPVCRRAEVACIEETPGRDAHADEGYELCEEELHAVGLSITVKAIMSIRTYVRVAHGDGELPWQKYTFSTNEGYYCPIGRMALLAGKLLGQQTGR
ncbi:hypothetical protein QH494_03845 [Sphingomonas sp. AR_OL41]|uniref:hypothetical protein n=1 Tax=Sphingomonas sp. AR_OL41 TaxID=3042729 RepID=UPI0024809FB7|nr:hypothetical protein [Sphingomonas sp. AR_OL41]MDH7971303.1 hypothetical protein [Sphingomonas sp. AR_OL41]